MSKYTLKEVIDCLNALDDYERTNTDGEQHAVRIAKFIISKMGSNTYFEIEHGSIKIIQ